MPKTTKKVATKKPVAKKAPAKKVVKKVVKTSAPVAAVAPVVAEPAQTKCCCGGHCHCGCRKGKKIIVLLITFIIGFAVSQLFFCGGCPHKHAPQPVQFINGCVDVASVKCPKMLEDLSKADANHDGCITRDEMRANKKATRHHKRPAPQKPAVNVEDSIAPVME